MPDLATRYGVSMQAVYRVCCSVRSPVEHRGAKRREQMVQCAERNRQIVRDLAAKGHNAKTIAYLSSLGMTTVYAHLPTLKAQRDRTRGPQAQPCV